MVGRILNGNDVYGLSIGDKVFVKSKKSDKCLEATVINDGICSKGEKWQEIKDSEGVVWTFPDDIMICDFYYSLDNENKENVDKFSDEEFDF